jgi:UMP-CMP kinase
VAKKYNFLHLSAGDLLRAARDEDDHPHAELIREFIREGKIVPREITISLLKEAMDKSPNPGFLIDGFPRAVEQAEGFEKQVCFLNLLSPL